MDFLGLFQLVVHQYRYNRHHHHQDLYCLQHHLRQYQTALEDLLGRHLRYLERHRYHRQDQFRLEYRPHLYPLNILD